MENACHRYSCEVAFADTDASGLAHFSKILTYVERAEHEMLAMLDIDIFDAVRGGWPRVRIACDYRSPLKFRDKIEVALGLSKIGSSSLTWRFGVFKDDGRLAAEGEMVCVKVDAMGVVKAMSAEERRKLEALS